MADAKDGHFTRRHFLEQTSALMMASTLIGESALAQTAVVSNKKDSRLTGKTAVVTGAARGIGRAICVHLARAGADVMGIDIAGPVSSISEAKPATKEDLIETENLVKKEGQRFISVVGDVRDIQVLRNASTRAEKEWGHVDIVVPNAGIQAFKSLHEMENNEWFDIINVNLNGYANTLRVFSPAMVARKQGCFVLTASSQGRQGTHHGSAYCASKWGVLGLMKSAALDFGKFNIRVNAIIPGLVDTALTRNTERWREAIADDGKTPPAHPTEKEAAAASRKKFAFDIPWLQPDDIAPAAVFLASDEARWVTGAAYDVTGGISAHYTA